MVQKPKYLGHFKLVARAPEWGHLAPRENTHTLTGTHADSGGGPSLSGWPVFVVLDEDKLSQMYANYKSNTKF